MLNLSLIFFNPYLSTTVMENRPSKFNHKPGLSSTLIGTPEELVYLKNIFADSTDLSTSYEGQEDIPFIMFFPRTKAEVAKYTEIVEKHTKGDPIVWMAFPRKDSELSASAGWDAITSKGFVNMRQVSIDKNWAAIRFRREENMRKRA